MSRNIYDKVPYDSMPQKQGNLRFLETIADLYEIRPVDVRKCRVLELGTALGKTIIAQAEEFPESRFVGIDLSREQIDVGRRLAGELRLTNIDLRCADIMEIDHDWGEFDYIIVHGIYSWVPPIVQDKILGICRENLSARGIAMISYNTYPGWHAKEMVRNLLLFHVRRVCNLDHANEELVEAKRMLDSFVEMKTEQGGHDAPFYQKIRQEIHGHDDDYVFHEYLESDNRPCYFNDFCRKLKEYGLEHFSDFDWEYRGVCLLQENFRQFVRHVQDVRQDVRNIEQYLDYFVNRPFRASVICRENVARYEIRTNPVERYVLKMPLSVVVENTPAGTWCFRLTEHGSAQVTYRIPRTALNDEIVSRLSNIQSAYFSWSGFCEDLNRLSLNYDAAELKNFFETMIRLGMLKIALRPPYSGQTVSKHPLASGFSRDLVKQEQRIAVNPDFECFLLTPFQAWLVSRLDGSRSVAELAGILQEDIRQGRFSCKDQTVPGDAESLLSLLSRSLEELRKFLLVPP